MWYSTASNQTENSGIEARNKLHSSPATVHKRFIEGKKHAKKVTKPSGKQFPRAKFNAKVYMKHSIEIEKATIFISVTIPVHPNLQVWESYH